MAISKVVYGGNPLIDLTADTVVADKLLVGYKAHGADGEIINGSCTFDADTQDATATAAEILNGKTAYNKGNKVTGAMKNNGAVTKTLSGTVIEYIIPKGYHNGSGKVSIALESKTVTPTKSAKTIAPTAGKVLGEVTVEAIPDDYQDVTPVTATARDVLEGSNFVDNTGKIVEGTIPIIQHQGLVMDGLTTTFVALDSGYYINGATVTLNGDIEEALAAI